MAVEDVNRYLKARRKAHNDNNLVEAASFCNLIGVYYSEKGEHEKALQYHREELHLSNSLEDKLGQAVAHRKIGEVLADQCKFTAALNEQDQYLKIASSLSNLREIQRAHATIGRIWYMKCKADNKRDTASLKRAKSSYLASLKVVDQLEGSGCVATMKEMSDMRARIYLNLGLLSEETEDLLGAEEHYKRACHIGKEYGVQESLIWQCHFNLGELLLTELGQANRALVIFEESLNYAVKNPHNRTMSLLQMGLINVDLLSWSMAKKYLKTCVKLNALPDDEQFDSVVRKYKAVCKIARLLDKLDSCSSHNERISSLEKMADICSHRTVSFYTAAIHFYMQELELAETHGLEPKRVGDILFSIAETYNDKEEYDKALEYYERELSVWNDHPKEAASSWCNIARVLETTGKDRSTVMDAYRNGIRLAEQSDNPMTIRDVYSSTITFLENCPNGSEEKLALKDKLDILYKAHPDLPCAEGDSGEEGSNPLDSQDTLAGDLILSCSSSEDEEEGMLVNSNDGVSTRQLRGVALRKKSHLSKRNEKGETALHVATIDGNFNRVKQLIDEGSDVNTKDHCGWTPLHEACNHGYTIIVKLLVDNGANVNDVGGAHCHQTTPLMDAAINGHVEIVSFLIDRNANLAKKNDKGNTALALVTQSLCSSRESSRYSNLFREHKEVQAILQEAMIDKGLLDQSCDLLSCDSIATQRNSHMTTGHVTSSLPVAIVRPLPSQLSSQDIPALIPNSDDEDSCEWVESEGRPLPLQDNWLFDDMKEPPHRKKQRRALETRTQQVGGVRHSKVGVTKSNQVGGVKNRRSNVTKSHQLVSNNTTSDRYNQSIDSSDDVEIYNVEETCDITDHHDDHYTQIVEATPSSLFHPSRPHPSNSYSQFPSTTMKLNVRIDDITYLVPCDRYHDNQPTTVAVLIEKVCDRYLLQNGRRPVLNLNNSQGALLCPTDNVEDVVQEGEGLVGVVNHWDSLLLSEHYQTVCDRYKTTSNSKVMKLLQSNLNPLSLDLSNCGLRPLDGPALFQSLLPHVSITSLTISYNWFDDSLSVHLSTLVKKLPNLYTLNASCVDLTSNGLLAFSQSLTTAGHTLPLRHLNLSHNSLGPASGSALSLTLSVFPHLSSLDLTDTGITSYTLERHTGLLDGLVALKELHTLHLSYNNIEMGGVNSLLTIVPSMISLVSLSIGNTSGVLSNELLVRNVMLKSNLTSVDLSGCELGSCHEFREMSLSHLVLQNISLSRTGLTACSMENLTRFFSLCQRIRRIDLSGNTQLTTQGVAVLLSSCQPSELLLQCCGLTSPLPKELYSKEKRTYLNLSDNCGISAMDKEIVANSMSRERTVIAGNIFIIRF